MASRKTITLSFSEYDNDIYEFLKAQTNASAYVRRLLLAQMTNSNVPVPTQFREEARGVTITSSQPSLETVVTINTPAPVYKEPVAPSYQYQTPAYEPPVQPQVQAPVQNNSIFNIAPLNTGDDFGGLDLDGI